MRKRSEVAPTAPATEHVEADREATTQARGAIDRDRTEYTPPLPTPERNTAELVTHIATVRPGATTISQNTDGSHDVTVTWGEEKYGIQGSYSACSVGPYSLVVHVNPKGDLAATIKSASDVLAGFAEVERERKLNNFMNKLAKVQGVRS